ncbi:restriction endonuclease subunit S [Paenibacillus sp. Y412MC10]|uniref:restriction endonuclease subunit S n=1 Tax=Geobacillus sp. (strain Y412MC10) TaxID=481743 RepID=UPI00059F2EF0
MKINKCSHLLYKGGNDAGAIRVDNEIINTKFLLYYLHFYKPKMLEIASTGVQAFLNMNHIKNFDILNPLLETQNQLPTSSRK